MEFVGGRSPVFLSDRDHEHGRCLLHKWWVWKRNWGPGEQNATMSRGGGLAVWGGQVQLRKIAKKKIAEILQKIAGKLRYSSNPP